MFQSPSKIIKDVKNLRNKMKWEKGTESVLILSFASYALIRSVSMFPEVFYMDVTCSNNQQNRLLFLMVVKVANGQTHVGNIRTLLSEKIGPSTKSFKLYLN